jgi:hypothetical protein
MSDKPETPRNKMILKLMETNSVKKSIRLVDTIFANQKFLFVESKKPQTVREYYQKYLAKN